MGEIFEVHIDEILTKAERGTELVSSHDGFKVLRTLGVEDFGLVLWSMPTKAYPRFSAVLPEMTSDEVTTIWTGASGLRLLQQSVSFVRSCAENYTAATGSSLRGKRILDFGCGYGRFLRLFSYYSNDVYGVDAWESSLDHSRRSGFGSVVRKSDEVPDCIPFDEKFDFLFAFSIFTHLSKKATIASLKALRGAAKNGAVLAITIRPVEFWAEAQKGLTHLKANQAVMDDLIADHHRCGFAYYVQDNLNDQVEECHYGDTSMTLKWLLDHMEGWKYEKSDRSLNDRQQRYIFLRAI